jgi:hypothetical protein
LTVVRAEDTCRDFTPRVQVQGAVEEQEGTRLIQMANFDGLCAMVDAADLAWLSGRTWRAVFNGTTFYACTKCKGKTCYMHRMIMDTDHDRAKRNQDDATSDERAVEFPCAGRAGARPGRAG